MGKQRDSFLPACLVFRLSFHHFLFESFFMLRFSFWLVLFFSFSVVFVQAQSVPSKRWTGALEGEGSVGFSTAVNDIFPSLGFRVNYRPNSLFNHSLNDHRTHSPWSLSNRFSVALYHVSERMPMSTGSDWEKRLKYSLIWVPSLNYHIEFDEAVDPYVGLGIGVSLSDYASAPKHNTLRTEWGVVPQVGVNFWQRYSLFLSAYCGGGEFGRLSLGFGLCF